MLFCTSVSPLKVKVKVAQLCLTLCDSMDCTVRGTLQARILEWVAYPFSRGSSQPRDWTQVSHIAGSFFTSWATRETQPIWEKNLKTSGYMYMWWLRASQVTQFSGSVTSNSLWLHGLQHTRLAYPSLTPRACSNSCPSGWWCHPTISSSVIPFSSCL